MTDRFGRLQSTEAATTATVQILYTVPSARGAKCRIGFYCAANSGGGTKITVAGQDIIAFSSSGNPQYAYSAAPIGTPSAATIAIQSSTNLAPTNSSLVYAMIPQDYYLKASDTVSITNTATVNSIHVDVVGVETDSS